MQVKTLKLSEVCSIQRGKRAVAVEAGKVPVYGAGSKPTKMTDKVNTLAPCIRVTAKATVGNIYLHSQDFWAEADCIILIPKDGLSLTYLYHWLKKNQSIIASLRKGSTMPGLDLDKFARLPFELPPMEYQKRVNKILQDMELEIRNLQRQAELNELRSNYVKGGILDV